MDIEDIRLSAYGNASSVPSPVNRFMAAFAADFREGVDVNLGVGYVNENTIPRRAILEALPEVLGHPEKYRFALNYGGPHGSPNLIESIRRYHAENRLGGLTADVLARREIIIGGNGASSLLEGISEIIEPGIVVTADPIYYIYSNLLERKGFELLAVPEDRDGLDVERLGAALARLGDRRRAIRCFYLVTINNPTCTILSTARRRALVALAEQLSGELGRKIPLFFDKAYEDLIHDPAAERPLSPLLFDEMGLVHEIGTLSKILAPALRIGYLIGPDGPFLRAMVQKTSDSGFSAPKVCQEIASYLLDHHVADQVARVNRGYREKAAQVRRWIGEQLGDALADCRGGQAGFYFYLTLDGVETREGSPFLRFLTRTTGDESIDGPPGRQPPRVLYIPGEFCVHARGELVEAGRRSLRLSYGFEETPRIAEALALMKQAVAYARGR